MVLLKYRLRPFSEDDGLFLTSDEKQNKPNF